MGPEAGLATPAERRRGRSRRVDAVAAQRPRSGGGVPGTGPRARAAQPRRRRRGLRRARRREPARPRLPARGAHGRPVKIVYSRAESFFGHVHRHPGRIWMRHSARARRRDRHLRIAHRARRRRVPLVELPRRRPTPPASPAGPYRVPNALVEAFGVRTNNPPCGAMRGFGVGAGRVSPTRRRWTCLADACGLDPVELRLRNALAPGDELLTGQRIEGTPAGGRRHPRLRGSAAAGTGPRRRLVGPAGWRRADRRRGRRPPRCRIRGRVQEPHVRRGLHGRLDGPLPPARRRRRHHHLRGRRGRAGIRHAGPADRPHGARCRRRHRRTGRHGDRLRGIDLGEPPDDHVGRRGREGLPRRCAPSSSPEQGPAGSTWPRSPRERRST